MAVPRARDIRFWAAATVASCLPSSPAWPMWMLMTSRMVAGVVLKSVGEEGCPRLQLRAIDGCWVAVGMEAWGGTELSERGRLIRGSKGRNGANCR